MKRIVKKENGATFVITSNDPDFIFDSSNVISFEDVDISRESSFSPKLSKKHVSLKDFRFNNSNIDEKPQKK